MILLKVEDRLSEARATLQDRRHHSTHTYYDDLELCFLDCAENRALEGARCLERRPETKWREESSSLCYLEAGELDLAARAAGRALTLDSGGVLASSALASVAAATGHPGAAVELKSRIAELRQRGLNFRALEVETMLGRAEVRRGLPQGV